MKRLRSLILAGLAAWMPAAGAEPAAKPSLDVPAGSRAFETLRRVQTRQGALLPSQAFPQPEAAAAAWLGAARLLPADSAWLKVSLPRYRREALRWADTLRGNTLFVSPGMEAAWRGDTHADSSDGSRLGGLGGTLYGTVGSRLSFYSRALAYTEYTDKAQFTHQANPEFGETYGVEKGVGDSLLKDRTFNRFEIYAVLDLPWVALKAGRNRVHMGPGYFSSLMANRDTPPYYNVEARINFASWLTVDNYVLRMTDTDHGIRKYANLHRFEFKPHRSLSLAFQDMVIYQDRDPDSRYLLPLAPLTFTESDIGGPDNSAMGFDFLFAGVRNFSVWGELFLDDLMGPASFFDEFWENRWAALAGFQVTSPFPWLDADLVVEHSRVEPWTYNGRKPQTSFKHFNVPSASRLGPDSRTWDFQLSYRPVKWLELRERLKIYDKGLGRPGTLGTIHEDALDGQTKHFLGGPVRSDRTLEQEARFLAGQYFAGRVVWAADFGDEGGNRFFSDLSLDW